MGGEVRRAEHATFKLGRINVLAGLENTMSNDPEKKVRTFEGTVLPQGCDYAYWLDGGNDGQFLGLSDFFDGLTRKRVRVTVEVLEG